MKMVAVSFVISIAVFLLTNDIVHYREWTLDMDFNTSAVEGWSWMNGRLDMLYLGGDTARVNDKTYNVFPPLFTIISAAVFGVAHIFTGEYLFPDWVFTLIILVPLVATASWAFVTCTGSWWKASLLGVQLIVGTALLPQLTACRQGWIWQTHHVLSVVGLLLIAGDCLGKKRLWPSLLGLLIAAWTRQLTILFAAPLILILVRQRAQWLGTVLAIAVILGLPMTLNLLKFGSVFDSGYARIYEGRSDAVALRAKSGLFAIKFFPENFYYMNLCVPLSRKGGALHVEADDWGDSMWIGTPVLLYVFIAWRQWWHDRARRILLLGATPVVLLLLLYHNTGWLQMGHYRFSLDFIPIVLAVIAPFLWGRWRTPLTITLLIWSVIYFRWASGLLGPVVTQPPMG